VNLRPAEISAFLCIWPRTRKCGGGDAEPGVERDGLFLSGSSRRGFEKISNAPCQASAHIRHSPGREDTLRLIQTLQSEAALDVNLAVRLIYGCGLRVTEPLAVASPLDN